MDNKDIILIIDDELSPRESLRMVLKDRYIVFTAGGGVEGLNFISQNPVDLVILDIKMPEMDGITVLQEIKKRRPDIEVILLTAHATIESAKNAVRLGALDYLTKPFDMDEVVNVVERGLEKRRANEMMRLEREKLLDRTVYLEEQINKARENFLMCYEGTVKALILTIDAKDHYTFDHSLHVARLSTSIANGLGMSKNVRDSLEHAAIIHDIGKIGVDENILRKNGSLTPEEFAEMKKHPEIGARIVQQVPFLEDSIPVILYHHERYDGKGYPEGLKGEDISLPSRIVMVADAIDAMMHDRPYRNRFPIEKVFSELRDNAGTQFDPKIVDLILEGKIPLK